MSDASNQVRREIEQLLEALRQDIVQGSVTLYRKHLAEDATVLAMDTPQVFRGKEACLEYVRAIERDAKIQSLKAEVEDFKLLGDVAVVIERSTAQYEVRDQTYRDTGRTTWVLVRGEDRWLLTHAHLESLAPNRIIDRGR